MYCGNCGNLLDRSYFVCRSCLIPIEDPGLRTNEAERVLLGLSGLCTLVSDNQRNWDEWEVARLDRIRNRGQYSFHSAKVVVVRSRQTAEADIPLAINVYCGQFDVQEELDELQWEESEKYLAIVAAPNWFMTLAFAKDYQDEHCDLPYKIAKALGGEIVFENGGLEPEFRKASELTELMSEYDLWDFDPDAVPKSRKIQKAWYQDEYSLGYKTYVREDGEEVTLDLHAQIFTRNERVQIEMPLFSSQVKLIGNGWMVTVIGPTVAFDVITQYAEDVQENLGCEVMGNSPQE